MKNMITVFDDFYDTPNDVRKYALGLEYDIVGNYPGFRSRDNSLLPKENSLNHNLGVKQFLETYFGRTILKWDNSYNGGFQYVLHGEQTWIHKDQTKGCTHAALIFLHPNPPPGDYGTTFFKHLESNTYVCSGNDVEDDKYMADGQDKTKWSIIDYIGYKFNRLVLYDAGMWHCANNYFGDTLKNSRLFQCFFFEVEDYDLG